MASEGIMIHENGIILDANQAFLDLFGFTSLESIIGRSGVEIIRFTPVSKQKIIESLKSNSSIPIDVMIEKEDGTFIYAETQGKEITFNGKNTRLVYMRDITKRKLAEQELLKSVETHKMALDVSKAGTWDWDIENNIFNWSAEFLKIFHMPAGIKPGFESWKSVLHPDDIEIAVKRIQESIDNKTELLNEYRIIVENDEIHWIRSTGKTFYKEEIPHRMLGLCIDITEQKNAEVALKKSEELFKSVVNNSSDLTALTDMNNKVLFLSPQCERVLGFSADKFIEQGMPYNFHY
jgi:PAS domain S-box-containing protein